MVSLRKLTFSSKFVTRVVGNRSWPVGDRKLSWTLLTTHEMDKRMRAAKLIPRYYGFAKFRLDQETLVFRVWPVYFFRSFKLRFRIRRIAINNWLQKKGW
jgi:hypothetical protein